MREFLDVTAEMTAHSQTLDDLHQQVARGEQIVSSAFRVDLGVLLIHTNRTMSSRDIKLVCKKD